MSVSRWTHATCEKCWNERHPDREAIRTLDGTPEKCCWCSADTRSGIYVRSNPDLVPCLGEHADTHDDGEGPRPHEYRCLGCERHRVCWQCGSSVREIGDRCTNLACLECHTRGKCGGHSQ